MPKNVEQQKENAAATKPNSGGPPPSVAAGTPNAADDRIADYTFWLMVLTGVLGCVGAAQSLLIWKQIKLGQDEFNATHRPHLFVQSVQISSHGNSGPNQAPARLVFQTVNGGETACRLTNWQATIYYQSDDAMFTPNLGNTFYDNDKTKYVLGPGEFGTLEIEQAHDQFGVGRFDVGMARLFVVGRLTYEAKDKVPRVTGFCREYDRREGMWHPVEKSEYEYAY